MAWSHDFCLYCDKQTSSGAYCSQTCRVADLEKSEPASPVTHRSAAAVAHGWQYQSQPYSLFPTSSSSPSHAQASPQTPRTLNSQSGYFTAAAGTAGYSRDPKRLSTSSSRSSLSSTGAQVIAAGQGYDQAYTQLRDYANSFDQTRDWKRRQTLG